MDAKHAKYRHLIDVCKSMPPTPTAVVHPCDDSSLRRRDRGRATRPDRADSGRPASAHRRGRRRSTTSISPACTIVDAPHSDASAAKAVQLVREGKAEALMKGSLHTDELMGAVVRRDTGLRTARRVSHCFVMDVPGYRARADHHRRRRQHRADARGQGRHPAERDRPRARAAHAGGARRDPVGDGDRQSEGAVDGRGRRAVQDGRPRPDHRRARRRAARARQRDQPRSRRRSRRSIRRWPAARTCCVVPDLEAGNMLAKSLSFLAGRRRGGHRARRARADHPHEPRRFGHRRASRRARSRRSSRRRAARTQSRWGEIMSDVDSRAQRRFVEHQVRALRCRERRAPAACCTGRSKASTPTPHFVAKRRRSAPRSARQAWPSGTELGHDGAIDYLVDFLRSQSRRPSTSSAVGHRVVHGGMEFTQAVRVDAGRDRPRSRS